MECNVPLAQISEVYQKIGRNVLLFQELEILLKFLAGNANVSGYASEIKTKYEQQIASVDRQTMGQVKTQALETFFASTEENTQEPESLVEVWVSRNIKIGMDDSQLDAFKASLDWAVIERNELSHQLVAKFDLYSGQGAKAAIEYLDQQHEQALPILAEVKFLARRIRDGQKTVAALFENEELVDNFYVCMFLEGPIVSTLNDIAEQKARADGWTDLSAAGKILQQKEPTRLAALRQHYGKRPLKELVRLTELFEIYEEPIPKGGVRVLYRKKPDHTIQVNIWE